MNKAMTTDFTPEAPHTDYECTLHVRGTKAWFQTIRDLLDTAGRKASAQKGVKTKLEKALEYARIVGINVPTMGYDKVVKQACQSYNEWNQYDRNGFYNDYFTPADPLRSDADFLRRITTNYLRHECSNYEQQLYKLFGKTGVHEAHDILQKRINEEIKRIYPQLKQ